MGKQIQGPYLDHQAFIPYKSSVRTSFPLPPNLPERHQKWKLSKVRHIENVSGFDRGPGHARGGVGESSKIGAKCLRLLLLQNLKCFLVLPVPGLFSLFLSGPPKVRDFNLFTLRTRT